jgi:hypothetical protein
MRVNSRSITGSDTHLATKSLWLSAGFGFGNGIIYLGLYFPRKAKSATGPDKLGILGAGHRLGLRI